MWGAWPTPCKALPTGAQPGTLLLLSVPPVEGSACCHRHWLLFYGPYKENPLSRFRTRACVTPQDTWSRFTSSSTRKAQGKEGAKADPSCDGPEWCFRFLLALCWACACPQFSAINLIILLSKTLELSCHLTQELAFAIQLPASHHGEHLLHPKPRRLSVVNKGLTSRTPKSDLLSPIFTMNNPLPLGQKREWRGDELGDVGQCSCHPAITVEAKCHTQKAISPARRNIRGVCCEHNGLQAEVVSG